MSSRLPLIKLSVLGIAIAVHAYAVWYYYTPEQVEITGSTADAEARLGSSFTDLVTGVETAAEVIETVEPVEPTVVEPSQPETIEVRPETPDISPDATSLVPIAQPVSADQTADLLQPIKEQSTKTRPKKKVKQSEPHAKPKPETRKSSKGNANKNANAGGASSSKTAQSNGGAATRPKGGKAGNAAASNYPGKVMKKISRVSRPRVGHKGAAVLSFKIATNGSIGTLSIASSSGSQKLDKAALAVLRRAAPFPRPPAGARTSFTIKIEGR
ncbi:TonB family protein [Roseovarius sp. EL26]|uniref:TonB family protein n=1 Tax=Roseovarius sp. EL26 TaxID=2126672 RepID=UPI000EA40295|nr:TonB family protein [Roseovarius sp. EL26]